MKAVAVGDLLLPASVFDETIRSASWVTAYDSFDWDVTKKRDELRNVVRRMETGGSRAFLPTQEELERLKDAEVILSHLFTIPREVFEAAPKLRYILSARGGVENIDLKAAHEHGVSVIHCPAHNAIAVAEYAIGLMIAESRNITRADRVAEKYPNIHVVASQSGDWEREKGMNAAANMMQSVDIDAFFGLCDEMSLGAVQAVKQANGKQLVFSFDGNPNAAEAVKSGDLMCTLSIGGLKTGEECVNMIDKILKGETVDKFFTIETEVITKDNVDAYLATFE